MCNTSQGLLVRDANRVSGGSKPLVWRIEPEKLAQVPATPENLAFFRQLFESLFRLSEAISDKLDPDSIQEMALAGRSLLGPGKE